MSIFSKKALFPIVLLGLCSCDNLERLHHSPLILSRDWCKKQACLEWGGWTISQPSSSLLVFFLTAITLMLAGHFLKNQQGQAARYWWGISLFLGGLGALVAGISFQAFGYEIKCSGNEICSLTSWWEIAYNIFTVWGAGALLIAIAYSSMKKSGQKWAKVYALMSSLVYTIVCLTGAFLPNAFLVSFELMILFTLPAYLYIIVLHLYQFFTGTREKMLVRFLICWLILAITFGAYYFYLSKDYTSMLWNKGIWFSENDVLHVLMLIWCFYVYFGLSKYIVDQSV